MTKIIIKEKEVELNRKWIYEENTEDPVGETNFVVPYTWLEKLYEKHYKKQYNSFKDFLDAYTPETEGEFIYKEACKRGKLIEDIGEVRY